MCIMLDDGSEPLVMVCWMYVCVGVAVRGGAVYVLGAVLGV